MISCTKSGGRSSVPFDIGEFVALISETKSQSDSDFVRHMGQDFDIFKALNHPNALAVDATENANVITIFSAASKQLPAFNTLPFVSCPCCYSEPRIMRVAAYYLNKVTRDGPDLVSFKSFVMLLQDHVPLSVFELRLLRTALQLEVLRLAVRDTSDAIRGPASIADSLSDTFHTISATSWDHLATSLSTIEPILKKDPASAYSSMDWHSKQQYRTAVGQLAKELQVSESKVSTCALSLAADAQKKRLHVSRQHIGFYVVDPEGTNLLAEAFNRKPPSRLRFAYWLRQYGPQVLFSSIVVLSLSAAITFVGLYDHSHLLVQLCDAFFLSICLFLFVLDCVQRVVMNLLPRRRLWSMESRAPLAAFPKAVVAVPSLLRDNNDVEHLCGLLASHAAATDDKGMTYILLTDFADASARLTPKDEECLLSCEEGIRELNKNPSLKGSFILLHRNRRFASKQGCWMGIERKRGKLEQLILLLHSGVNNFDYVVGDISRLREAQFVLSLDEDSRLSDKCVQRLLAVANHPLNVPAFTSDGNSLSRGYGIVQPRVTYHNRAGHKEHGFLESTRASRSTLNATRPYPHFYQDLFHITCFNGKGLLHVDAYSRALTGRIPVDRVLSHDVVESAFIRTALASNIAIEESRPNNLRTLSLRTHRWIRGDWHNIIWLLPTMPNPESIPSPNTLTVFGRWMIFVKLVNTLSDCALFYLTSVAVIAHSDFSYLLFPLIYILLVGSSVIQLATRRSRQGQLDRLADRIKAFCRKIIQLHDVAFTHLLLSGWRTYVALHAIGSAVFRMLTGHHLLDWTSAAYLERVNQPKNTLPVYVALVYASLLIGLIACALAKRVEDWNLFLLVWTMLAGPYFVAYRKGRDYG